MKIQNSWILIVTIIVIALTRLLPHPPNFSPVVAIALFGGAALADRKLALLVPMAAMLVADLFLGFHNTMVFVYVGMSLVVALGCLVGNNRKGMVLIGSVVAGSAVFFVISNAGMWWLSGLYEHSADGLLLCYAAALPFFHNTLLATAFYASLLFGFEYWLSSRNVKSSGVPTI